MGLPYIFRTARLLGDKSSLQRGFSDLPRRAQMRVVGRAAGKFQAGLSVHNLIIYAQFIRWVREAVEDKYKKPVYVVNPMKYAPLYEAGFPPGFQTTRMKGPPGYRFWSDAIVQTFSFSGGGGSKKAPQLKFNRSGLYIAGRFAADIRAIYKGKMVARLARRSSGRELTRFFWGTLRNPKRNVFETLAARFVANVRRNIRNADGGPLVDTEAMVMSTQMGSTVEEALAKGRAKAYEKLRRRHGMRAHQVFAEKVF